MFQLLPVGLLAGLLVAAPGLAEPTTEEKLEILVEEGDTVQPGRGLIVLEAMKMELAITAASAGVVTEVAVDVGQAVEAGAVLAVVDATGVN